MKYSIFYLFAVLAFSSFTSVAEEFSISNVGTVRSGGYAFIDVSPDINTATGCSRKNQIRWEIGTDTDKALFSLAIAAQASNSKVDISFIVGDCLGDSPRPNVLRIMKNS